ncbi:MAG: GWxTD domain-containing protein [Candidatus Aminicenantes bacterium]
MTKARGFIIILLAVSLGACASFKRERNLSPEHEEFFSKVRYIITSQEKKIFLNLIPEDRDEFVRKFWKKRDPSPESEVNEFKEQYYQRIEEANRLFSRGQNDGWLRDRGRIYILLGPPENRSQYPTGITFYGSPTEIWYYGPYPIVFTDEYYTGEYRLYPISAQYVSNLLKTQMDLKPEVEDQDVVFDFMLNLEKFPENRIKVLLTVPVENIFFIEKNGRLETTLSAEIDVFSGKNKLKTISEESTLNVSEENFLELMGQKITIPVEMELQPGKYRLNIRLQNSADEQRVEKAIKFTLSNDK